MCRVPLRGTGTSYDTPPWALRTLGGFFFGQANKVTKRYPLLTQQTTSATLIKFAKIQRRGERRNALVMSPVVEAPGGCCPSTREVVTRQFLRWMTHEAYETAKDAQKALFGRGQSRRR